MSNNLLQNTTENTQEIIQKPIMSAYTVNTAAFQAVMEREFTAYLKNMKNLGLLTTSIKACKDAIATGVAVEVKAKKSTGRPKKAAARKVSDGDILDDMIAKADSKPKKVRKPKMTAEEKAAKKLLKEQEKAAKKEAAAQAKAEAKAAKALAASQAKAEKAEAAKALKEKKALEKEQAKVAAKAAKKLAAEQAKAEKAALKEAIKAEKAKELEKQKLRAEKIAAKEQEKALKKAAKAELKAQKKAEKKAAKKAEDERKKKEALALMTAAIEDTTNDVPITNEDGEVVGSKVEGFNLPEDAELVEEEYQQPSPEGYEEFTHDSRAGEQLYIDPITQNVFKADAEGDLDHIGQLDADGTLLECCESSDEEEGEFPEM